MASDTKTQRIRQMMKFLRHKMRSPDAADEVIVRRHEVEEFARSVGMVEEEAWRMFRVLKGTADGRAYMRMIGVYLRFQRSAVCRSSALIAQHSALSFGRLP